MSDQLVSELVLAVTRHRDERDWKQFHSPKELAISLCVEAAELLSLMQWKNGEDLDRAMISQKERISDELADVLHSLLLLSAELNIALGDALLQKLRKDALKYPLGKARGRNVKYDQL